MAHNCPPPPALGMGRVESCRAIAENVFCLTLVLQYENSASPIPGQFYLIKACPSGVLLGRPISLYRTYRGNDGTTLEFLILKKGTGSAELCALKKGDSVDLLGPQGNSFPRPKAPQSSAQKRTLFIGGGIGVAPVAGFAATLDNDSYDFYACFRSGSYGTQFLKAAKLVVVTEDGSTGVRGRLPDALCADDISREGYGAVYACGPEPMLAFVQKICAESNTPCFLSVESRMACGVGACLGCTIRTTDGNRRCCVDGPVFAGETLRFPLSAATTVAPAVTSSSSTSAPAPGAEGCEADLSVTIAGVRFQNPVIAASGTFGYGTEYGALTDVNRLGGICSKGLTLEARSGNEGVRLHETAAGLINSIGLENPGIPHFIAHELPKMLALLPVTIANLSGSSLETYATGAALLEKTAVKMIELNISCPNVKAGGMAFGLDSEAAASVTRAVREMTSKPLMVKLSPNAPDLLAVAHAVREAGADALSMVNTFQATAIDVEKARPIFERIYAGLSGPAIKPIALRMVYDTARSMQKLPPNEQIPIVALGGIASWRDAAEFIMAGASAVQVGTAIFSNPHCLTAIIDGLAAFMRRKGYASVADMRGVALGIDSVVQ